MPKIITMGYVTDERNSARILAQQVYEGIMMLQDATKGAIEVFKMIQEDADFASALNRTNFSRGKVASCDVVFENVMMSLSDLLGLPRTNTPLDEVSKEQEGIDSEIKNVAEAATKKETKTKALPKKGKVLEEISPEKEPIGFKG